VKLPVQEHGASRHRRASPAEASENEHSASKTKAGLKPRLLQREYSFERLLIFAWLKDKYHIFALDFSTVL
jgi:hypothetical protein